MLWPVGYIVGTPSDAGIFQYNCLSADLSKDTSKLQHQPLVLREKYISFSHGALGSIGNEQETVCA